MKMVKSISFQHDRLKPHNMWTYAVFSYPLLKKRVAELKENATRYTYHKNRKGITQTTSIVDNYLNRLLTFF
jgi:hypothetical protein